MKCEAVYHFDGAKTPSHYILIMSPEETMQVLYGHISSTVIEEAIEKEIEHVQPEI